MAHSLRLAHAVLVSAVVVGACGSGATTVTEDEQPRTIYIEELGEPIAIPELDWPPDLPYAERPAFASEELLAANGYSRSIAAWLGATESREEIIREAAYHLLARHADQVDIDVFRQGVADEGDRPRVWAAWGLLQKGDESAREILVHSADMEPRYGFYSPIVAASLLAELGDGSRFSVLEQQAETSQEPHVVARYIYYFVPLHGRVFGDVTVDVWRMYRWALEHDDDRVVYVTLAQLDDLGDPRAIPLLEALIARRAADFLRREAERILSDLQ